MDAISIWSVIYKHHKRFAEVSLEPAILLTYDLPEILQQENQTSWWIQMNTGITNPVE